MTYTERLIGKTVDCLFCEDCKVFEIMITGKEYKTSCEKCGFPLQILSLFVHAKVETDYYNEKRLAETRIKKFFIKTKS